LLEQLNTYTKSIVRLRSVPASKEDGMNIAHELQHLILDAEGFPTTGSIEDFENISSALSSMILDPIVDSKLSKYGFDLCDDYQREVREKCRQLRKYNSSPSKKFDRVLWIFNYVSSILDWELKCKKTNNSEDKFQSWFDERYPDIAEEGKKLLALIREIGYDTPEKLTMLFNKIIQRYGLDDFLKVGFLG
jgi:hypothetical protein